MKHAIKKISQQQFLDIVNSVIKTKSITTSKYIETSDEDIMGEINNLVQNVIAGVEQAMVNLDINVDIVK